MEATYKILEATKEEFDLMFIDIFLNWAGVYAEDNDMLQQIITCKKIAKWYNIEYERLNAVFKDIMIVYCHVDVMTKREFYVELISMIYDLYPENLIKNCKIDTKIAYETYNLN